MPLDQRFDMPRSIADLCCEMVERAPYGVFVADDQARLRFVNEAACGLTGRDRQQLLGTLVFDLLPPDWQLQGREHFERVRRDGRSSGELQYLHADGSRRWWSLEAVALAADRYLAYAVDVTDRHELDQSLKRQKARLSRASEVARVGWWEIDLGTGLVTASSHARAIYGFLEDRVPTLAEVQQIPLPEYRQELDAAFENLVAGREPYDVQFRIRRPSDGEVVDIRSLAEYDRDRNRVFGVLQDVTSVRQAEAALRSSEARLRAIFDTARDFIFLKNRNQRYTHVNPACGDLFKLPLDQIIGRTDRDLFEPAHAAEIEAVDRIVLAGSTHRGIFERDFGGRVLVLETIKVPVRDDAGEVVGICGFSRDITDMRHLEAQLRQAQKMEAVGRLAGGVAHDFNNLLTPILGFADLLAQSPDMSDHARKDLQAIVRAAERARDLTAQLLAFGRKQVLEMRAIDLNDVVREGEPMLRRLLPENIQLRYVLADGLGTVRADVSQLHNILLNLAVNAADAMRDGGRLVIETQNVVLDDQYVRTHPGTVPGPHVLLAVSDTGCGMDAETLGMIFEPFFTTKQVNEGTGLGLATVHGIVKQHQGSVQAYSEPGHGTQFKIYLPRIAAQPVELPQVEDRRARHGSERILLVEDDDAVRNLAMLALGKFGYTVLAAATPATALEMVAGGLPRCDLLLSDVVMPGMNGVRLHRTLSAHWPDVPALFMSGYTSNVIAHHGVLDEGLHYLQKPFTPQDLAAKVREVLDG